MVKNERRPSTATLIKPTILDTKLLGIFDMTTVSREHLLAIKNLVHSTPRCKCRPMTKALSLKCDQKADTVQALGHEKIQKVYKVLNKTYRIRTNVRQKLHELSEAAEIIEKPIVLPAPCSTCGRSDQPERFHSHPSRVENQKKYVKDLEDKKTVQKPVAVKFRSAKTKFQEEKDKEKFDIGKKSPLNSKLKLENKSPKLQSFDIAKKSPEITPIKESTPKRKIKIPSKWREAIKKSVQLKKEFTQQEKSKPTEEDNKDASEGGYKLDNWNPAPVSGGRKRKVVCYLCSQEFGTAALPAHEAMCIQKYLKQNNQQHNPNDKKEATSSQPAESPKLSDNWKLAWEITQASLVPCDFCDRKFLPARLEAHQRICTTKSNKEHIKNKVNNASYASNQPGVLCEHCGKRYGSNSIVIHKEQCVKKCRNLNETIDTSREDKENSIRKFSPPPTVICYICGRNFGTKSIAFHEPQCLKKWKMENAKLPIHLQKTLPIKFDVFEQDSELNYETQELFWKAHQAQLVPCPKCYRTFYPDRLEVHLKGCKGPTKNKK